MFSTAAFDCSAEFLEIDRAEPPNAIVGAGADLAMHSARLDREAGVIEPCLLRDRATIRNPRRRMGWDIRGFRLVFASPSADWHAPRSSRPIPG